MADDLLKFDNIFFKHYVGEMSIYSDKAYWKAVGVNETETTVDKDAVDSIECVASGRKFQIRFLVKSDGENGKPHFKLFTGFSDDNLEQISGFLRNFWKKSVERVSTSIDGDVKGDLTLTPQSLEFFTSSKKAFDIYHSDIEQCLAVKNDLVLEHKEKSVPFEHETLSEIRFHFPAAPDDTAASAAKMAKRIRAAAALSFNPKNNVAQLADLHFLTPRGHFEASFARDALFLRGKTLNFKIELAALQRMFLLPNLAAGHFLVVCLKRPLVQGKTTYPFVIANFPQDAVADVWVNIPVDEIAEKYHSKLAPKMAGPSFKVVTRIIKALSDTKVFMPGAFESVHKEKFVRCAFRTSSGLLYPLEASLVFCPKPFIYVQHAQIESIEFLRIINNVSNTKLFDMAIKLKKKGKRGGPIMFTGIDKIEFETLFSFLASKPIHIVNKETFEKSIKTAKTSGKRPQRSATNIGKVILSSDSSDSPPNDDDEDEEKKAIEALDEQLRNKDNADVDNENDDESMYDSEDKVMEEVDDIK